MTASILLLMLLVPLESFAFSPKEVLSAEQVKRNIYVSDTTVYGGDALANPVTLAGVRWARNPQGFERIVIDLSGEGSGWESKTPPYFHVGTDSRSHSISVNIRGVSGRKISSEQIHKSLTRSSLIVSAYLAPDLEGDLASLEFRVKEPVELETFYLVSPPRIVVDLKTKH